MAKQFSVVHENLPRFRQWYKFSHFELLEGRVYIANYLPKDGKVVSLVLASDRYVNTLCLPVRSDESRGAKTFILQEYSCPPASVVFYIPVHTNNKSRHNG